MEDLKNLAGFISIFVLLPLLIACARAFFKKDKRKESRI